MTREKAQESQKHDIVLLYTTSLKRESSLFYFHSMLFHVSCLGSNKRHHHCGDGIFNDNMGIASIQETIWYTPEKFTVEAKCCILTPLPRKGQQFVDITGGKRDGVYGECFELYGQFRNSLQLEEPEKRWGLTISIP